MLWFWTRTRVAPSLLPLLEALITVVGVVTVSSVVAGGALHPLGIVFALIAAAGNATV